MEDQVTEIGEEKASGESAGGKKATFARLRDEEQRVAGGGRWSVDSSRRFCALTREEIPRGTPFWTVLAPADPGDAPESAGRLTAFFSRQDYCDEAMAQLDSSSFFARWRTVIPEESGPEKRVVNVASLLATFLELVEPLRSKSSGEEEAADEEGDGSSFDPDSTPESPEGEDSGVSALGSRGLQVDQSTDRLRLAYLLALFLVRKRALIWEDHDEELLKVREKASEEIYEIPTPAMDRETLEGAIREIESIFG